MSEKDPSDGVLVARACRGDPAAFDTLVRRPYRAAYAVALAILGHRTDAEDVCQDGWVRALERLVRFDPANMKTSATSAIHDVVMPHPLGAETWPLSGSITRAERIEGGPNGTEERTSILTFNGTQYATLTIGDKTVRIDLKDPKPPKPPRP